MYQLCKEFGWTEREYKANTVSFNQKMYYWMRTDHQMQSEAQELAHGS